MVHGWVDHAIREIHKRIRGSITIEQLLFAWTAAGIASFCMQVFRHKLKHLYAWGASRMLECPASSASLNDMAVLARALACAWLCGHHGRQAAGRWRKRERRIESQCSVLSGCKPGEPGACGARKLREDYGLSQALLRAGCLPRGGAQAVPGQRSLMRGLGFGVAPSMLNMASVTSVLPRFAQDLAWELGRPSHRHGWMLDRLPCESSSDAITYRPPSRAPSCGSRPIRANISAF